MMGIQISSRLYRRTGPRRLMVAGLLGAATMAAAADPDSAVASV